MTRASYPTRDDYAALAEEVSLLRSEVRNLGSHFYALNKHLAAMDRQLKRLQPNERIRMASYRRPGKRR